MNSKFSERAAVLATVDPQTVDNTTKDSDFIDMSKWGRVAFILALGAVDTTTDMKLQADTAGDGNDVSDISGKAITQLDGDDDNKQAIIEIRADEMPADKPYVRARATVGDGSPGNIIAIVGVGIDPRYGPASDNDLASVAEIVA